MVGVLARRHCARSRGDTSSSLSTALWMPSLNQNPMGLRRWPGSLGQQLALGQVKEKETGRPAGPIYFLAAWSPETPSVSPEGGDSLGPPALARSRDLECTC